MEFYKYNLDVDTYLMGYQFCSC